MKLSNDADGRRTINFLRRLYRVTVYQRRSALVDLSAVEDASTPSLTVLAAELSRCQEVVPGCLVGVAPRRLSMAELLSRHGIMPLLGLPETPPRTTDDVLRVKSGLADEIRRTEFLDRFLAPVFPGESALKGRVKGALTEALLNIVDHAYPEDSGRADVCPSKRWWISGLRSKDDRKLWFCVYDMGVGLPATLPKSRSSAIRTAIEQMTGADLSSDHKMIKVAVHTSLTQTGAKGRGRGLREMAKLIDRSGNGTLWILSRDGTYLYQRGDRNLDVGSATGESFRGTLIVWHLTITNLDASMTEVS